MNETKEPPFFFVYCLLREKGYADIADIFWKERFP